MKSLKTIFMSAALLVAVSSGALATTFSEYDAMNLEQKGAFLDKTAGKIYTHLAKNDSAKAQCMIDKFTPEPDSNGVSEAFLDLEKKIKGVPDSKRTESHVEDLMAYFVIEELCNNKQIAKNDLSTKHPSHP